jgi:hypothetical protein
VNQRRVIGKGDLNKNILHDAEQRSGMPSKIATRVGLVPGP